MAGLERYDCEIDYGFDDSSECITQKECADGSCINADAVIALLKRVESFLKPAEDYLLRQRRKESRAIQADIRATIGEGE